MTAAGVEGERPSALLVASTGGHLKELLILQDRLELGRRSWVTFDNEQSRALLAGQRVHWLRWTGSRDYVNTVRNIVPALTLLRADPCDLVVSTGSAIALSVLPAARALGMSCCYIESATRATSPSMTGRVLERVPGIRLLAQYPGFARRHWSYAGSVFDGFDPCAPQPARLDRVVVTVGTMRQYGFRRALQRLRALIPSTATVLWQTGSTDLDGLRIPGRSIVPAPELEQAMREADLVVAHAGVGSALAALEAGRMPVLLPRRYAHGEHVDDHQAVIGAELQRRGLAVTREADRLGIDDLLLAAGGRVGCRSSASPAVPLLSA